MKLKKLVMASACVLATLTTQAEPVKVDQNAAVSVFDSRVYRDLFGTEEMRGVFSDKALVNRWIEVEVVLAKAQADLGIIPQEAYESIRDVAENVVIDYDAMRTGTNRVGRGISPLLGQLRAAGDENVSIYLHFGSTTQDIMDTATVLQVSQGLKFIQRDLKKLVLNLADLAEEHKTSVMISRTNGQDAIPTTFGLHLTTYMMELHRHIARLEEAASRLTVQIGGAVGTLSGYGDQGLALQEGVAKNLGLKTPYAPWNPSRDTFAEIVQILGLVNATLGRIADDVNILGRTQILEIQEGEGGASSTMPQKRNPRAAEFMGGLSRMGKMYNAAALDMMSHTDTRQGAPWILEWAIIPEAFMVASESLHRADRLFGNLIVNKDRMLENFNASGNYVMSEAVMNALAEKVGRTKAYDMVKEAIATAPEGASLDEVVKKSPTITQHLTPEEIEQAMNPENYLGVAGKIVDQAVKEVRL